MLNRFLSRSARSRPADVGPRPTAPHTGIHAFAHPARHAGTHHPIRLIALDLDGTLLRTDKDISRPNMDAIAACLAKGVKVVLASARPPRAVKSIHAGLKLDSFSVHYNGALVHDLGKNRPLHHNPMTAETVKKIITAARKLDPDCMVSIEILDRWFTDQHPRDAGLHVESAKMFEPDFIGPLDAFLTVPVTKLMLLAPARRLQKIHAMLRRRFTGKVAFAISDDHLVQVMNKGVDKWVGLSRIAALYGIDRKQIMAIGDAPNDIGMVRWAGLGVAVGNAWPELKKHARDIVPSNDDDGVAHALDRYVLQ